MTAFLTPTGRTPRGAVKINDEALIKGWIELEVTNNAYYSADTFRCKFAGALLPADRDAAWFSRQQDMFVEIFIGFPANPLSFTSADLQPWIYGQIDRIILDPITNTIEIEGRDLTRVFIDTKTTQKWPNQTSSEIATQLAASHGLTAAVTATATKVGKYYEVDHVQMADERSEWDILTYLANLEGFRVWLRGKTLYFQPAADPSKTLPYQLVYQVASTSAGPKANFQAARFQRDLMVSRGIQVKIRSWNKKFAKGFTVTYPSTVKAIKAGSSSVGDDAQTYSKTIPNLTQEQAIQRAKNWYDQIVAHEMKIEGLTIPGDNDLDTTSLLQLSGTGTAFDQIYYLDSITRTLDFENGYEMTIEAKNHAPDSTVTV